MRIRNLFVLFSLHAHLLTTYLCLFLVEISAVKSNKYLTKPAMVKKPDIWLKGYKVSDSLKPVTADTGFRTKPQMQNEFVSKNGTDFVVSSNVNTIDFSCEADYYPIMWVFPNPEQSPKEKYQSIESDDHRISELYANATEPINIRYKTTVRIHCVLLNFLSVNITCKSVENSLDFGSSIYVFLEGNQLIENQGETIRVNIKPSEKRIEPKVFSASGPVVLPCRPATPNLKVSLQKEVKSAITGTSTFQTTWKPLLVPDDELFRNDLSFFDPKFGFILFPTYFSTHDILGLYKCSVVTRNEEGSNSTAENDQFVKILVSLDEGNVTTSSKPNPAVTFQTKSILHGEATAGLYANNESILPATMLKCCSGDKNNPPKMYLNPCRSPFQCKLLKYFLLEDISKGKVEETKRSILMGILVGKKNTKNIQDGCTRAELYEESVVAVCQGDNIDFVDHFINIFHPLVEGPVSSRWERLSNTSFPFVSKKDAIAARQKIVSLSKYETEAVLEEDLMPAQTMMIIIAHQTNETKYRLHLLQKGFGPGVLISDYDIEDSYVPGLNDGDITDISKSVISRTVEYNRDYHYEGEPMLFICLGLRLVYERGAHFRLIWRNGTETVLNDDDSEIKVEQLGKRKLLYETIYLSGKADMFNGFINAHTVYGITMKATTGMRSVDCWMPKRSSRKWDKISKELQVIATVAPAFTEKENETEYLYIGDVGKVINCTVEKGTPFPKLRVTRNGKDLKLVDVGYQKAKNLTNTFAPPKVGTRQYGVMNEASNVIAIKIVFATIGHEDYGSVFQCTATNINKTTTRTIRISVAERAGIGIPIALSCLAGLLLGLGALGVKLWYGRRRIP